MQKAHIVAEAMEKRFAEMVEWRRYLHRNPELSYEEQRTAAWIAEKLSGFGCEVTTGIGGGHGVMAVIRGGKPGPVIALRADIDALPIQDEKNCDYCSTVPGVMHACGHDGHTAALLGVAAYYIGMQSELAGERRLLFQPAEEVSPGGAVAMIAAGVLDGVDAIYGVHLWSPIPYGKIASKAGPLMAAADEYTVEIIGKGGHGALPHETIDTVVIGSALVQTLQTIVSRSVDPLAPSVVTVGSIHAGTTANVIAERCELKGTVRTFDEGIRGRIKERLAALVEQTCAMHGASGRLDYRDGYPAVVNDERETARFFEVAAEAFGSESVEVAPPIMAGEDYAYYLQRIPGCFMFVGAGNSDCDAVYPHHHPKFNIDERAMLMSARLLIGMAEHYAADARPSSGGSEKD
jgi:amidohydrolase